MADPTHWIKHIESFVDSSSSPTQQATSVDAIATLLKDDLVALDVLVREMEMYLTTTDTVIRSRGILFLAELLSHLTTKPLDEASVHSLIVFFRERLTDWKALRGALVGCLALLKRKNINGIVSQSDAKAVVQNYLQYLSVQSLGQYDRKLSFELLKCLLDYYPDVLVTMGDDLFYGICEAIDREMDPECLMLTFHIVKDLAQLFPNPSGPLARFSEELFEILGSYFPIYFTHAKGDVDAKREGLSRALMLAFSSTPLFEPFAIPLLLEKLSSSLPSAKLESLKYLSYCTVSYGADRMVKHAEALWYALKDTLFTTPHSSLSAGTEAPASMGFPENEIMTEALGLLQKVAQKNNELFIGLILGDEDMTKFINSITSSDDVPMQRNQQLYTVGCILSVSAKISFASCNRVFESFFPCLMKMIVLSVQSSAGDSRSDQNLIVARTNFEALYLCVELLDSCRYLVVGSDELSLITVSANETSCVMLHECCGSVTEAFCSTLLMSMDGSSQGAYVQCGVKGLQILATFPGCFQPVSKSIFEIILRKLMSVITSDSKKTILWKLVLRALVEIGSFIDKFHDSEKAASFNDIVVEKVVALMSSADFTLPSSLKVEAITEIGMTGMNFMLRVVQELDKAISVCLAEVHGNLKSSDYAVQLLECYSTKVLPWFHAAGDSDKASLHFAINMWDQIEKGISFSSANQEEKLLNATMMAMKHAVASCSKETQSIIVCKAITILSASGSFRLEDPVSGVSTVKFEGSQASHNSDNFSCQDDWIISLFASVIVALRPQTNIPNVKVVLQVFLKTVVYGHVPSAQALGSLVNKLPLKLNGTDFSDYCSLEDAMNIIVNSSMWISGDDVSPRRCSENDDGSEMSLASLRLSSWNSEFLRTHSILGLAWIGKGLLMRGYHEKVKDITMTFLSCLLSSGSIWTSPWNQDLLKDVNRQKVVSVMTSAADAFHILMCDAEACLNKRFHATIRPLYKQRFFNIVMPILVSSVVKSDSAFARSFLYRAIAHVISDAPLSAVISEAKKLIPVMLDGLCTMSGDILSRDIIYNVLLVLSGMLMDKNGKEAAAEHAHLIISGMIGLISYPHMMLIRETAIQCLVAMSQLSHARIYPMRSQVLQAVSKARDDPKRTVRQEAVRCRQAWISIASRSL